MQSIEEQLVCAQRVTVAFQLLKLSAVMPLVSHVSACAWFAVGFWGSDLGFRLTWLLDYGPVDEDLVAQRAVAS